MKHDLQIFALTLLAVAYGYLIGVPLHAGDYARGYAAGYAAPHPVTQETKVVNNLLCHYAEVACVPKASHAQAH